MVAELFDTHCHIHEADADYGHHTESRGRWHNADAKDADALIAAAVTADVTRMICVGTTLEDSQHAVNFVSNRDHVWASVGLHPHEAKVYAGQQRLLQQFADLVAKSKVVAVGECGLDYYYNHSPRQDQLATLEFQLDLARQHGLPVIFHVREAFDDLWPVLHNFPGIRGVIHSFTADQAVLRTVLDYGLYVGLNGIMTFTKDVEQLAAAKAVPLDRLVLETDAPFLTPSPYRGKVCEPKHVAVTAEFLSRLRTESVEDLRQATTVNACALFRCV